MSTATSANPALTIDRQYGAVLEGRWVPAPRFVLRRDRVLPLVEGLPAGRVIEVGCGSGALLRLSRTMTMNRRTFLTASAAACLATTASTAATEQPAAPAPASRPAIAQIKHRSGTGHPQRAAEPRAATDAARRLRAAQSVVGETIRRGQAAMA